MTALDIIVILLVGGGAVLGGLRGFVTEALSLFAWVLAILAVKFFHTPVTERMLDWVGTSAGAATLAFAVLFGVTFLVGKYLARAIGARTRQSVLGAFDRLLGVGFGALKGLIFATLIFLVAVMVLDTINGGATRRPEWVRSSHSYPLLNASGKAMVDYMNQRRLAPPDLPVDRA
ncbi:CvpA family protein [Sphingomonas flavalba]|uniref:CvpA family protein n=1 Tax=Sphingomonas flavalba TaxID=2559804 RepID=UPI0039E1AAAD